jgi:hydrogenase maturation protease
MVRLRVIGLGNSIVSDDAVGLHVARAVRAVLPRHGLETVDVVEAEVGGFHLLELMAGWEGVVIVDALEQPGRAPGEVVRLATPELGTSLRLCSPHEISLPMALRMGAQLGYALPRRVVVIGVQGEELRTFGERLTPRVEKAVTEAVRDVMEVLKEMARDWVGQVS